MKQIVVATKAAILHDNRILLLTKSLEEQREDQNTDNYDLPGGRLEYGEQPEVAIKREIKEETGLSIDSVSLLTVESFIRKDGVQFIVIYYLATSSSDEVLLSKEHIAFNWVDLTDKMDLLPDWISKIIKKIKKF